MPRRRRPNRYLPALRRLPAEGLVRVAELLDELGVDEPQVVRWVVRGVAGVRLEGFESCRLGWVTSRPALARFRAEVARRRAERREAA